MMNSSSKKQIFSLFLILFSFHIFAEQIIFSANSMTGKTSDKSSSTELKGNAYILTSTMEIKAESIQLYGDDYRFIQATGNVSGKNLETKMEFSADNLNYDRTTKIAILNGNVNLIDTENSVTAKAQRIEYNQDKEIAILQIEINLKQKENECTGAYAIYYKADQILELSGNAQVKQKQDTFRAQNIHFNMKTEEITLGGNVKGSVTDTKESSSTENETSEVKLEENENNTEKVETAEQNDKIEKSENEEKALENNNLQSFSGKLFEKNSPAQKKE